MKPHWPLPALLLALHACPQEVAPAAADKAPAGMVWIPPGTFTMGSGEPDAPLHQVTLHGFFLDVHEVTNAEFERFVKATGYVTDAERKPTAAELPDVPEAQRVAGALVFHVPAAEHPDLRDFASWWSFVP